MARLTLEENGAKRRFKLNPGKLTIGSGDGATLKLASPDVAEVHAELLFEAGVARLKPRPGVLAPTIGGRTVAQETVLAAGSVIKLGGATLTLEYDEGEGPKTAPGRTGGAAAPAARQAPAAPAAAPGRKTVAASAARTARTGDAGAGAGGQVARRGRRPAGKSMPTWAILAIFAVLGLLAVLFGPGLLSSATSGGFNPVGAKQRFEDFWRENDTKGAGKVLEEFKGASLSPEWQKEYDEMRARFESGAKTSTQGLSQMEATQEWQNQLSNYYDTHLASKATRPKARVFVRRLRSFRERHPNHDQREWVDRMLTRFEPVAQLDQPSTLEDLQWEVNRATVAKPRKYKEAFAAIDEFTARTSGPERDQALALKAQELDNQKKFFDEELLGAAVYYDKVNYPSKFNPAESVNILVELVAVMADPELADEAARRLVQIPEFASLLPGYKAYRRKTFDAIMENATVRAKATSLGITAD